VGRRASITMRIIRSVWHRNGNGNEEKSRYEDVNMLGAGMVCICVCTQTLRERKSLLPAHSFGSVF
jgi:hypothetical protein